MKIFSLRFFIAALLLVGCARRYHNFEYIQSYRLTSNNAITIIEEMVEQQPSFVKNKSVTVTEFFWEYHDPESEPTVFNEPVQAPSANASSDGNRFYFRDIRKVDINTKKEWITVQLHGKGGKLIGKFYTKNLTKATKLADAFNYMKNKARYNI